MARSLSLKDLYAKKFKTLEFTGLWKETMGQPESNGAWIVYGAEKNGKTWFSLKLAEYLSNFEKTLYISAEEGAGKTFVESCRRAKIQNSDMLLFDEYLPLKEIEKKVNSRRGPKILLIDNMTIYADEFKYGVLQKFLRRHSDKLIVFIAHEEKGQPYTATAKMIRKLSKIIIRVEGLACQVSGRCKGGTLMIDYNQGRLYHGTKKKDNE